jgi:protein-S-isoprenylcysteine O-methyltransferase Ste14
LSFRWYRPFIDDPNDVARFEGRRFVVLRATGAVRDVHCDVRSSIEAQLDHGDVHATETPARPMLNFTLRTIVWFTAFAWAAYLTKSTGSGLLVARSGFRLVIGICLGVFGLCVYTWSALLLARSVPSTAARPATLLERGPYSRVRNPLYVGAAAVFAAIHTLYAPWRAVDVAEITGLMLLAHLLVLLREEPAMRARFGTDYDRYCRRVPRWIPRLRRA